MALTNCPECDGQVSTDALTCPHCGHPLTGVIPQSQSMRQADGAEVNEDESLLEVYVGSNWFVHYQDRFMRFLREDRSPISWNWAACFVPGWYLYRKLYGWFFAFVALSFVIGIAQFGAAFAGGNTLVLLATLAYFAVPVLQGMYGDYLVYRRSRRVINHVRATTADADTARRAVSDYGGTSFVAPLVLLLLPLAVVWMGILAAIAIPKFAGTKEKAYIAAMKSDLRNLVNAQESYFADYTTYGSNKAALGYGESTGVTVTISNVSGTGWQATALHAGTTVTCIIYIGGVTPATSNEGQPYCN